MVFKYLNEMKSNQNQYHVLLLFFLISMVKDGILQAEQFLLNYRLDHNNIRCNNIRSGRKRQ